MAEFSVAWVEIPVTDLDRAKTFYEALLEGECTPMPNVGGRESLYLPWIEGRVGGSLLKVAGFNPTPDGPVIYFNVGEKEDETLEIALNRAIAAGGTLTMPKLALGGENGHIAVFTDTEGNTIGLWSKH